jgi:hypothetical protein
MEFLEFIDLVRQMRTAQKEYFKTRDKGVLERSKSLERQVDRYIVEQTANTVQINLKLDQ